MSPWGRGLRCGGSVHGCAWIHRQDHGQHQAGSCWRFVRQLNVYFTVVVQQLLSNNATVDKYIGDAVLAYFGAQSSETRLIMRDWQLTLLRKLLLLLSS